MKDETEIGQMERIWRWSFLSFGILILDSCCLGRFTCTNILTIGLVYTFSIRAAHMYTVFHKQSRQLVVSSNTLVKPKLSSIYIVQILRKCNLLRYKFENLYHCVICGFAD